MNDRTTSVFKFGEFEDSYGVKCSIQEFSATRMDEDWYRCF